MLSLLLYASTAFIVGSLEDYTGIVSAARRRLLTMEAALLGHFRIAARLGRIDLPFDSWSIWLAWVLPPLMAAVGIANAMELRGRVDLSWGRTYFLGFMPAELVQLRSAGIELVPSIAADLSGAENGVSAYRRVFVRGKSPPVLDGIHLHSLIFRRIVQWAIRREEAHSLMQRNAMRSPYLWLVSLAAVIPATVFWRNAGALILFCLLFIVSYVWLHARIVRFKSPRWLIWRNKN